MGRGRGGTRKMGQEGFSSTRPEGVEALAIGDRAEWLGWRKRNVNASEAACLWGDQIHPFMSAYRLWALRSGRISDAEENAAMKRGLLLEDDALDLMREQKPSWDIWQPQVYLQNKVWRIGCTPDAYAIIPEGDDYARRAANVQVKTVGRYAFLKHWIDPDTKEVAPPLWIAVQATIEALMTGLDRAFVAALVIGDSGTLDLKVIEIPMRPGILPALMRKVKEFWRRVDVGEPYAMDYFKDTDTVLEVYREEDGGEIDLSQLPGIDEKIAEHQSLTQVIRAGEKAAEARKRVNAWLVGNMGNARYGNVGGFRINAGNIKRTAYQVNASSYRFVRISEAK
jgi:predicted phage-related endonuclease